MGFGDVNPPVHAWAAWRVYKIDRKQRGVAATSPFWKARLPQAAAELHVVGQSQGPRATTCSRAASWASTTSASSTARPLCPPAAISSSPTAPAGWRCTASTCWPWRWSSPRPTRPTRTWPASSSSTFSTSAHAMNRRRSKPGQEPVGRGRRFLLRLVRSCPTARRDASQGAIARRPVRRSARWTTW